MVNIIASYRSQTELPNILLTETMMIAQHTNNINLLNGNAYILA